MDRLFSNPAAWFVLCCVGGLVLGLNLTLVGLLRGDKRIQSEASKWSQAFGGSRDKQRQHEADYTELHRRVAKLNVEPGGQDTGKPDSE